MTGLTSSQVQERRQQGQGNDVKLATSRTLGSIIRSNVFSPVNLVLYVIGVGMILVGDTRSALTTVGLVVFNAGVGIIQELRAKRKLDEIALLARAKVVVLRDGREHAVDPAELVLGDVLRIQAGDQIPVDGQVLGNGLGYSRIEVDESALTGESDLISKSQGDELLSGSFCISGETLLEATRVGEQSFANNLTKNARAFKTEFTPLQREVNRLLRVVLLIVLFFGIITVLALFVVDLPFATWLQITAVIAGSVSAGLLTLIVLNYSWGAVRIGQKGGLVQQLNAIESLSNVTVLCTDKTGTLTANKIQYHDIYPVGLSRAELEKRLADFAASVSTTNKTSQAIQERLSGERRAVVDEVPFSSARKWSAVAYADGPLDVLGALEMLETNLTIDEMAYGQLVAWSDQGLRVLVLASKAAVAGEVVNLHNEANEPMLPALTLLGLVSFSDELRPHLRETLQAFTENGVRLKVISGDNPQTVAALARQAGLPGELKVVSGPELEQMSVAEFSQTAVDTTIFGRITPQQKEALVTALRDRGEYVAMIGDGVNDVLSLKKANMGIAMESGSTATRAVAAMILLGDSFEAMPLALTEGQRIINSIQNILKLFMVTVFALLLLIVAVTMLGVGFPFTAQQNTLLSFFARGVPPFILAMTAVATRQRETLAQNILHFTLPASLLLALFGLLIYLGSYFVIQAGLPEAVPTPAMLAEMEWIAAVEAGTMTPELFNTAVILFSAQTALTHFFIFAGILLMVFAQPPLPWFAGGAPYRSQNWLVLLSAIFLLAAYLLVLAVPGIRGFFQLVPLPPLVNGAVLGLTLVWLFVQRTMWRARWLERFLDIAEAPDA